MSCRTWASSERLSPFFSLSQPLNLEPPLFSFCALAPTLGMAITFSSTAASFSLTAGGSARFATAGLASSPLYSR